MPKVKAPARPVRVKARHPKAAAARLRERARERAGEAAVSDMSNGFSFGDPE